MSDDYLDIHPKDGRPWLSDKHAYPLETVDELHDWTYRQMDPLNKEYPYCPTCRIVRGYCRCAKGDSQ